MAIPGRVRATCTTHTTLAKYGSQALVITFPGWDRTSRPGTRQAENPPTVLGHTVMWGGPSAPWGPEQMLNQAFNNGFEQGD
jgi:hypothetical protein